MRNYWNLKLSRRLLIFVGVFGSFASFGQLEENHIYKENYYLFPIKPGIRNTLAGTMGELRSSHFHTGLDIRTEGKIGLPVHASAPGYITRIAVSTSGYGNAIYILHPNGHTTVYAHLDRFHGALAQYVREEQYRRKTFELNLYFRKDQFKVDRGDTIAFGGNSGSSGGPHLHFDLRDENQNPLNPLKYGFSEVLDNTPPVARKIAIKTMDKDARVNGQFGRHEFELKRIGNNYVIDQPIEVKGKVGIELYGYDILDNARFRCGITTITMTAADQEVFKQEINTFSFSEQRNILKHMSYPELHDTGERYHKLYVDDGNELRFYTTNNNRGKLHFESNDLTPVKITMTDSYNNVSYVDFKLKSASEPVKKVIAYGTSNDTYVDLIDNTLVIKAPADADNVPAVYTPERQEVQPTYVVNNQTAVFLWDMRNGLPHSVDLNGENRLLNYKEMVAPQHSFKYYNDKMDIYFPEGALFDTLYLQASYDYIDSDKTEQFIIGDVQVPLKKYISVTLKPQQAYKDPERYSVYALDTRGNAHYKGGKWEYGRITFWTRDFGKFTILEDTIPPKILPVRVDKNELRFKISDERSGIDEIKCYVDDEWVLMNYDYKTQLIWSEKLDFKEPFSGEVKLTVTDNQGNKNVYSSQL